jgi:hypothetical protein
MQHSFSENIKPRLIERNDILRAINLLRLHGCRTDELAVEITRLFYIDLDEFNKIVGTA